MSTSTCIILVFVFSFGLFIIPLQYNDTMSSYEQLCLNVDMSQIFLTNMSFHGSIQSYPRNAFLYINVSIPHVSWAFSFTIGMVREFVQMESVIDLRQVLFLLRTLLKYCCYMQVQILNEQLVFTNTHSLQITLDSI